MRKVAGTLKLDMAQFRELAAFDQAPRPFMLKCSGGQDRTSFAAALYLIHRGGWSESHMDQMKNLRVKKVAVAPRGKEKWKVSKSCEDRLKCERAQVEGKIGTLKHYGFNKPEEKTTPGMKRAARRAELRFNLGKLYRDLTAPLQGVPI